LANEIYDKFTEAQLTGAANIDLENEDVRLILVDAADYTFSQTHDMLDDVPGAARVAVSGALTGKTVTDGVFNADDVTFTAVTGDVSEALILYRHTGVESTSRLIAYLDTGFTGLPVTPSGTNITVAWNASGIFKGNT
jgi:hypothetical protein